MCSFKGLFKFTACERGVAAIIFAIVLIPVLLIAGAAVDYTHVSSSKAALQEQLDSAILAGAGYETSDPEEKKEFALKHFYAAMPTYLKPFVHTLNLELTSDDEGLRGTIDAVVPTQFMYVLGWDEMRTTLVSEADIKIRNRQLDMAFCIDATGTMQEEIDGVTKAAASLESAINEKLKEKDKLPFDAMRVRVIFYRDFSNERGPLDKFAPPLTPTTYDDPNYADFIAPMNSSNYGRFWTLPDQRASFRSFLDAENAVAGNDEPEAGFVCLNEALSSDEWAQKDDPLASDSRKTITEVTHLIAFWTDANARPIDDPHARNLPRYQPRSYDELKAKWDDPGRFNQGNKLLIFFGDLDRACATTEEQGGVTVAAAPATRASDETGSVGSAACPAGGTARWRESIGQWGLGEHVFNYSLLSGANDPAGQIADALSKQKNTPRLTK